MLTGKIALVTGGGRGIGSAVSKALAEAGATVIVNYNGSAEAAQSVVDAIREAGSQAEGLQCDVSDAASCEQMVKTIIDKYGRVDILVNNAGITRDGLLMRMSEQDFEDVMNINLKGAFHTMKYLSRYFLKQKSGKIINISSVSGILGNAGQANYAASKAGLIGMTKSVARELASRGICVNAVAPGFIDTDMTKAIPEASKAGMLDNIPLGRLGTPEDVAKAVLFLASESADYITGQVLCVDGGMAM